MKAENNWTNNRNVDFKNIDYASIQRMLDYVKDNYRIDNIVLVFSPGSDLELIKQCEENGFRVLLLITDNYKSWLMPNDSHWSCYGHQEVARQVANYLEDGTKNMHLADKK